RIPKLYDDAPSPRFGASHRRDDSRAFRSGTRHDGVARSGGVVSNDHEGRSVFRNLVRRRKGTSESAHGENRHRNRIRQKGSDLSVLAREPTFRIASFVLGELGSLGEQPGLCGWDGEFRSGDYSAVHGMPFNLYSGYRRTEAGISF